MKKHFYSILIPYHRILTFYYDEKSIWG
ncbi:TPA: DUF504 domain-containing protein [Klebsiella pneumoniae]|nr:DUF504 domain-containing protein [Klebsiella pneumoniae]KAE8568616.1 DUF504 domain-containing protein [Klebsiella pneumoniae subsp. pneumoniae]AWU46566.1 DUF504 domain-containing protein [Klebsiella pneumoniae]AXZ51254.1 DUF504 domain-containing protein [Klebsiella pneumoniae]AYB65184.1 DUF504 domain-containing protein [Klebsiella pneumoniae]